jgi:leucyl aminopeptidase
MQVSVAPRSAGDKPVGLFAAPTTQLDPKQWKVPSHWRTLDRQLGGSLAEVIATGDFCGKRSETLLLYGRKKGGPERILLIGLGAEEDVETGVLREAGMIAAAEAGRREASALAMALPAGRKLQSADALQAAAEGLVLGTYRYEHYKSEKKKKALRRATLLLDRATPRDARASIAAGVAIAESQNLARDLSNQPPCDLHPVAFAREARRVAREVGLRCRILEPAALRKLKMGAMLAVAQGSDNPPRLIVLEHNAPARGKGSRRPTLCLVGKGVTFDSGGLSLKPSTSMVTMKHDMSGGAAVLGALRACAKLKLPLHVVGIIGAVENMPSAHAYRPDDVLTSASGQTIEIGNTDAEGRLVLADALHYARTQWKPAAMVDVATLTGAIVIALGSHCAGVMANNDKLAGAIHEAGEACGERFWQLPLWDVHRKHMKSHIADVRQVGGREASSITAAAFLSHFVGDTPWAHLDIAGTANTDSASAGQPKGATGFGVRALVRLAQDFRELSL